MLFDDIVSPPFKTTVYPRNADYWLHFHVNGPLVASDAKQMFTVGRTELIMTGKTDGEGGDIMGHWSLIHWYYVAGVVTPIVGILGFVFLALQNVLMGRQLRDSREQFTRQLDTQRRGLMPLPRMVIDNCTVDESTGYFTFTVTVFNDGMGPAQSVRLLVESLDDSTVVETQTIPLLAIGANSSYPQFGFFSPTTDIRVTAYCNDLLGYSYRTMWIARGESLLEIHETILAET